MGGITKKLFGGGDRPDPQLEADRLAAQRQAEEEQARQEEKDRRLRNARMRGRVGYSSLLGAGTGDNQTKKSLLG